MIEDDGTLFFGNKDHRISEIKENLHIIEVHIKDMIDRSIRENNSQGAAAKYSEQMYNRNLSIFKGQIKGIKQQIERIRNKTKEYLSLLDEGKKELNNQQLRSGLQGLIKEQIDNSPNSNAIKASLPEPIAESIKIYRDVPFNKNKGGKTHKRNKRNKRNKRRTRKSRK